MKIDIIVSFKTGSLDAHLTGNGQRKFYIVYERQWNEAGDEYVGDMICSIDKLGNLVWHKYPQTEYVGLKTRELSHLIDRCVAELNY